VVVACEEVVGVVAGLDRTQPCPRIGVEDGARVGRLLDEVGVVTVAVHKHRGFDAGDRRAHLTLRVLVGDDTERQHADLAG